MRPTGWLKDQLQTQVDGLSGHLQRFWPDVQNSTWLKPQFKWNETYSDRGGNLPYWLNGLVPLIYLGLDVVEYEGSTVTYNLSTVVLDTLRLLVANQNATDHNVAYPMNKMFNLGSWNVIRSLLMFISAERSSASTPTAGAVTDVTGLLTVEQALSFVVNYISAAQQMLLNKGWSPSHAENTLCTECDAGNPMCSDVVGQSHCLYRYPHWMWILQVLVYILPES